MRLGKDQMPGPINLPSVRKHRLKLCLLARLGMIRKQHRLRIGLCVVGGRVVEQPAKATNEKTNMKGTAFIKW